jgi:hypothetical protein
MQSFFLTRNIIRPRHRRIPREDLRRERPPEGDKAKFVPELAKASPG